MEDEDANCKDVLPACQACNGTGLLVMEDGRTPGGQDACPACEGRGKSDDKRTEAQRREDQPWGDMFNAVVPFVYAMRGDRSLQEVLPMVLGDPLARLEDINPWYIKAAAIALGEFNRLEKERDKKREKA